MRQALGAGNERGGIRTRRRANGRIRLESDEEGKFCAWKLHSFLLDRAGAIVTWPTVFRTWSNLKQGKSQPRNFPSTFTGKSMAEKFFLFSSSHHVVSVRPEALPSAAGVKSHGSLVIKCSCVDTPSICRQRLIRLLNTSRRLINSSSDAFRPGESLWNLYLHLIHFNFMLSLHNKTRSDKKKMGLCSARLCFLSSLDCRKFKKRQKRRHQQLKHVAHRS